MVIKLPTFTKKTVKKKEAPITPQEQPTDPALLIPIEPPTPKTPPLTTTDIVSRMKKHVEPEYIEPDGELDVPDDDTPDQNVPLAIPDDFTEEELITSITRQTRDDILALRRKMEITPVKTDFINLTEAAQLCSFGLTGNDLHFCLMKQVERDKAAAPSWLEDHKETLMVFAIIFAFIVIGAVIVFNVTAKH
jgi:hypothetical protein